MQLTEKTRWQFLEKLEKLVRTGRSGNGEIRGKVQPGVLEERARLGLSLFEATGDAVLVSDLETGEVVEANPAACRLFGYKYHELVGMRHSIFIHPDYQASYYRNTQILKTGGQFQVKSLYRHRNGEALNVEVFGTCYDYRGKPHALQIIHDVSGQTRDVTTLERARNLAIIEERQRIARELHDSVTQVLYGIELGTNTALTLLKRDPSRVGQQLSDVLLLTEAGLTEMRALIFELRPESLQTEGLVAALLKQTSALQARHGLTVATEICPEPEISLSLKEALYRIAQEAMHNTVKHAKASRVELHLQYREGEILLEVRDNGRGFDTTRQYPGHLGLHTMQERAVELGGRLEIKSEPGQGTLVRAIFPLKH